MNASVPKPCGPCGLCCKLIKVDELNKPAGQWCAHYARGQGCTIHAQRPALCVGFQCGWSMRSELDEQWRPDNSKFILLTPEGQLIVQCDPGLADAWRRAPYYSQIKKWSGRNSENYITVIVRTRGHMIFVFPEADIDIGPHVEGVPVDSGYQLTGGKMIPYARYVAAPRKSVQL
ncbi:MAG: hypothetical protein WAW96_17680 [Alphaproteobacteria bacterium]